MNLMSNSKAILVFGISLMVTQCFAPSVPGNCTTGTVCYQGQYCNYTVCLPCEDGFFMIKKVHKEVSCQPWTQKSGEGWGISQAGSSTNDTEWKCVGGYKEYNNAGISECRKISIQSTPVTVGSTSNKENGNTTESTGNRPMDSHEVNTLIIIIVLGIAAAVIIATLIVIYCLRKKKRLCFSTSQKANIDVEYKPSQDDTKPNRNNNDKESKKLLAAGDIDNTNSIDTPGVSSDEPNKQITNGDGSNGLKKNDSPTDPSGPGVDIPDTIPTEETAGTLDNPDLQDALEKIFGELCDMLGVTDGNKLLDKLKLKRDVSSSHYKESFTKCMMEWCFSPMARNDEILRLLGRLKIHFGNMERNDIVHDFDDIIKDVAKIINT